MRRNQKTNQKYNKNYVSGITTLSLVITIIVMIIIAAIAVNLSVGDNGVLNSTDKAKREFEISNYKADIELARANVAVRNKGVVTLDNLIKEIEEKDIIPGGTIRKIDDETAEVITKEGYVIPITGKKTQVEDKVDITIGKPVWSATTHKASTTITKGPKADASSEVQYQVTTNLNSITESNWTTGTNVENLNHNDYVCARLWNGTKGSEYINIQVKDKEPPTVTVGISDASSNGLVVNVSAVDNQYGMPTNPEYKVYVKKASEPDTAYVYKQTTNTTSFIVNELKANTNYTVKVETRDLAGNVGSGTASRPTYSIPEASENLTINAPTWDKTTHKASTTITKGSGLGTGYQVQYQVVTSLSSITESGWQTGTSVGNLNHNDYVCARLWDGTNGSEYISRQVQDEEPPIVTVRMSDHSSSGIIVNVSATDDQYGMPTNPEYKVYVKKASEPDSAYVYKQIGNTASFEINELEPNTNYTIKVETTDLAGNIGSGECPAITDIIPTGAESLTINTPTWDPNTHKASTTISKASGVDSYMQIQYAVVTSLSNIREGDWVTGSNVENLNHNDYVCARLWDGNNGGEYTSIRVLDEVEPNITLAKYGIDTTSIYIMATVEDNESGIPANPNCSFSIKKKTEPDSAYVSVQGSSGATCLFEDLECNTTYVIRAMVMDNAGNVGTDTIEEITKGITGTLSIGEPEWSEGKASAQIIKQSDVPDYLQIQYQVVNSLSNIKEDGWIVGDRAENISNYSYVCARLWDGKNSGEYISRQVLDENPPVIAFNCSISGSSVYVIASPFDNETGVDLIMLNVKKASELDSAYYAPTSTSSGTWRFDLTEPGIYTFRLQALDNGGNIGTEIWNESILTSPTKYTITYNANGGTGGPSTQTKLQGYNIQLTSAQPTREGYIFKGWATSSTSTTVAYSPGATYSRNEDITLYAVWQKRTYTIRYNTNGGSGAPSQQTKTYGTNLTLSTTKPTRLGYTFLGWSESSTATTATYTAGGTYSENKNVTLYAVWEKQTYTITYNANGGTGVPSQQTKTWGVNLTLSTTKPTKSGYTFLGWSESKTATTATYAAGGTYSENKNTTFYAVWKENSTYIYHNGKSNLGRLVAYEYNGFGFHQGWLYPPKIGSDATGLIVEGGLNNYGSAFLENKVDLSKYSKARVVVSEIDNGSYGAARVGFTQTCGLDFGGPVLFTDTVGTYTLDISGFNGNYYFAVATRGEARIKIKEIELIP